MELEFFTDPAGFLAEAGGHLAAQPVLGTVVSTVSQRMAAGIEEGIPLPADLPIWWMVAREAGEIAGVAMRTATFAPYPLFLLPMPDEAALLLARALVSRGEQVGGVNGALPAVRTCADEVARSCGRAARVNQHTRLFELRELVEPPAAPGRLRVATPADIDLVREWYGAFMGDADEQSGRARGSSHDSAIDRDDATRRIATGRVFLWEDEGGEVVHLTAANPPAYGVSRIGPVYTPPAERGKGYAASAVAAVSRLILDEGSRACLFTDQANPVSNQLYERLGYRPVADMANLAIE